ncbi:ferrochelatase [uncultured Microscilla sp.]|uniref:ferrochelatase n=1 Tax=uncultured Microscilla sp. TaxID=432653 RepID=UPI002622E67D|nr:ferrochelatase [uncultured Microscilla sp.]
MASTTHQPKTGVLIVNLGTPDNPKTPAVRRYLREFLMDGRVIDIPYIPRFLLVNGIISTFRAPKSAKEYQKLWTEEGSPIKIYGFEVEKLLQEALGDDFIVSLGMRYQNPSVQVALDRLKNKGLERIIVIPLFPQYASATSGSVHQKVMELVKKWQIVPDIHFVQSFFDYPEFVHAFAEIGKKYLKEAEYDHVLFSYHGLPERQIRKGDHTGTCLKEATANPYLEGEANCCATLHNHNRGCYRAQCFATTRLLAQALELKDDQVTTCFQSRLGRDPWLKPYTEDTIKELAQKGKKRVLAFSPAFVADCLETTIEVGEEYKEVFEEAGGEHWQLVESLNSNPLWIGCLKAIVLQNAQLQPKVLESRSTTVEE